MTTRKFEIHNQGGQGDVKAIITIECELLLGAEQNLVALDTPTLDVTKDWGKIFTLDLGPGYDRREVQA